MMPDSSFIPDLTADLEAERQRFAAWVVDLAAQCRNNAELIARLKAGLPADFLGVIGEGTTRRVYGTRLGVCVKVQRGSPWDDPLHPAQLEARGGASYNLELISNRRLANVTEISFAGKHPRLMPQQFGFLGSFGIMQSNPSVLVCETCKPLSHYFLGDRRGIDHSDITVDESDHLRIYDPRITRAPKPEHLEFGEDGKRIAMCNIGVTTSGHFVFIDRSDGVDVTPLLNMLTFIPKIWNGGWMFSAPVDKTLEFSKTMFAEYQKAWNSKGGG